MTVVADSSPLVILAKLGCFDLLKRLFPRLYISREVHYEVVVSGAGLTDVGRRVYHDEIGGKKASGFAFG